MSQNRNEIKKPNELDIDFENNQRALNRDMGKFKPVDGYYSESNEASNIKSNESSNTKEVNEADNENGFDYKKKYINGEMNETGEKEGDSNKEEAVNKKEDKDENRSGTKLNPELEQITEPDPDDKKRARHLYSVNKRNRNQPL